MVVPLREQHQKYQNRSLTLEQNIIAVIAQDRVIDAKFRKQMKAEKGRRKLSKSF